MFCEYKKWKIGFKYLRNPIKQLMQGGYGDLIQGSVKDNSPPNSRLFLGDIIHQEDKNRGCSEEQDVQFHFPQVEFKWQLNEYLVMENLRKTVSKAKLQKAKKLAEVEADSVDYSEQL